MSAVDPAMDRCRAELPSRLDYVPFHPFRMQPQRQLKGALLMKSSACSTPHEPAQRGRRARRRHVDGPSSLVSGSKIAGTAAATENGPAQGVEAGPFPEEPHVLLFRAERESPGRHKAVRAKTLIQVGMRPMRLSARCSTLTDIPQGASTTAQLHRAVTTLRPFRQTDPWSSPIARKFRLELRLAFANHLPSEGIL